MVTLAWRLNGESRSCQGSRWTGMRTLEIVEGNNVASVNERRREKDSRPAQLSTQAHASAHMHVRTHTQTTRGDSAVDRQTDRLTDTALESPETNSHSTQKRNSTHTDTHRDTSGGAQARRPTPTPRFRDARTQNSSKSPFILLDLHIV